MSGPVNENIPNATNDDESDNKTDDDMGGVVVEMQDLEDIPEDAGDDNADDIRFDDKSYESDNDVSCVPTQSVLSEIINLLPRNLEPSASSSTSPLPAPPLQPLDITTSAVPPPDPSVLQSRIAVDESNNCVDPSHLVGMKLSVEEKNSF